MLASCGHFFERAAPRKQTKRPSVFTEGLFQRQRADSNRRIRVLQTRPLPTWVRRHYCGCNISNLLRPYKGSGQKKSKNLSFKREIAIVQNKIARLDRRPVDEKSPHPPTRTRRLSTGNPRTMAQGPTRQLRSLQGQECPYSRLGVKRR